MMKSLWSLPPPIPSLVLVVCVCVRLARSVVFVWPCTLYMPRGDRLVGYPDKGYIWARVSGYPGRRPPFVQSVPSWVVGWRYTHRPWLCAFSLSDRSQEQAYIYRQNRSQVAGWPLGVMWRVGRSGQRVRQPSLSLTDRAASPSSDGGS